MYERIERNGAHVMRNGSRAVKKLLLLGVGSALMFTMGGVGTAQADGGVHYSTAGGVNSTVQITDSAGRCASCHRAHTAKAALLLKEAQPGLCYTCHAAGAGAATDVANGVSNGSGLALRGGGFNYALIGAGAAVKTLGAMGKYGPEHTAVVPVGASEATTSKHQIDGNTAGTMWGNGAISSNANVGKAAVTLECGSCHDPHGNGNYRILKPVPNDAGTAAAIITPAVIADPTAVPPVVGVPAVYGPGVVPVNIPDVPLTVSRNYTTVDYWKVTDRTVPAVKGGPALLATETDGYIANASQWCSTCHTRYLAKAPDYSTNSGDAIFAYRHTSGRVDKGGVERPNCIQCHVSHGSNAAMSGDARGLLPGDALAPVGDSRLLRIDQRGVCVACHNV